MLKAGEYGLSNWARRQACRERAEYAVSRPNLNKAARCLSARVGMNYMNDTNKAGRAERHWCGASDHFNAVEVEEIERCGRGVERPAVGHAVDHQ